MVEVAENCPSSDGLVMLDWPSRRGVLGQGEVGSEIVIVGDVAFEDAPKMSFSERDKIIDALATDRTDE